MPQQPQSEKSIERAIRRAAKAAGWWTMKVHGGPFQVSGIPDVLCLRNGIAKWMEVKRPGCRPTPLQAQRMRELEAEGGTPCAVVTSVQEALEFLG